MEFWKIILGLVRRRFVGPPVVVVSLIVAATAFFLVPTHYTSNAFMVLTTPPTGGTLSQDPSKPNGLTNPLLQFNDGLRTTAGILIQSMNTPEVAKELGIEEGGSTKIVINDGSTNPDLLGTNGPFVYVEGDSRSAQEARDLVVRAQKRVRDELVNRQTALGAPPSTFITVVDVVPASASKMVLSGKWQAAALALLFTVLAGFSIAYGIDRLKASKRWPTKDADEDTPAPPPAADPAVKSFDPPTVKVRPVKVSTNGTPATLPTGSKPPKSN
jgi:hypothetical protein